ncbi:MAG TPA: hypothetical protein VD865_10565 [Stenotrophomonas sp.]|nr:hypothetical protein [Stenotrophomonas sp.]
MGFAKTEAGRQEIEARTRRLPTALRSILLMVDGQRTDAELRNLIEGLKAPADALEQLAAMGLIADSWNVNAATLVAATAAAASTDAGSARERDGAQEYRWLYDRMSGAVGRYLGLKGYFLQLKIERCTDVASLQAVLPELEAALRKARGAAFTTQWLEQTRQPVTP